MSTDRLPRIARPSWVRPCAVLSALLAVLAPSHSAFAQAPVTDRAPVVVASKPFGESFLLAEMFAHEC